MNNFKLKRGVHKEMRNLITTSHHDSIATSVIIFVRKSTINSIKRKVSDPTHFSILIRRWALIDNNAKTNSKRNKHE